MRIAKIILDDGVVKEMTMDEFDHHRHDDLDICESCHEGAIA